MLLSTHPLAIFEVIWVILLTFFAGRLFAGAKNEKQGKTVIYVSVALLVITLVIFKYSHLPLPAALGLSYFTLAAMGYLLDVYRGSTEAERSVINLAAFLSFFPPMPSGPILDYKTEKNGLFHDRPVKLSDLKYGAVRMLWGCFKKLVLADRIALYTGTVLNAPETFNGGFVLLAAPLLAFELYLDFSGCMDIVLGGAECFGMHLSENFRRPFFSETAAEFWQRWHITLGLWAKNYLLYPMQRTGLFRKLSKKSRKLFGKHLGQVLPVYLTMLPMWILIGIWHGGSLLLTVSSGLIPWAIITLGGLLNPLFVRAGNILKVDYSRTSFKIFRKFRTFIAFLPMFLAFFSKDLSHFFYEVRSILFVRNYWIFFDDSIFTAGLDPKDFAVLFAGLLVVFAVELFEEKRGSVREALFRQNILFRWGLFIALIAAIVLFGIYGPEYNASDFIYGGF
ncbi:MAG: hypothetical protein K5985_01990 [Lachnospiraceae bacterium]|nr:hypothetical protein [Lachnospiraceae bacterium]